MSKRALIGAGIAAVIAAATWAIFAQANAQGHGWEMTRQGTVADLVTKEGNALVQRIIIDRQTGFYRPSES